MQGQRQVQRLGRGLARVIVGRAADAATRKTISPLAKLRRKTAASVARSSGRSSAQDSFRPRAPSSSTTLKMLVLATAGEDLVAYDDEPDAAGGFAAMSGFRKNEPPGGVQGNALDVDRAFLAQALQGVQAIVHIHQPENTGRMIQAAAAG